MTDDTAHLTDALAVRYLDPPEARTTGGDVATLARMAGRGSCRAFEDRAVDHGLLRTLAAVALAAPSKSDLQQRDVVLVTDPALRAELDALCGQPWLRSAPVLLVFCGNHRRQRRLHALRRVPFANDHLDAFFNAAVDAAIALGAFVTAAEAAGLGCCPVSAIRNHAERVSDLLRLPELVFPVAGLGVGWPAGPAKVSPRLPLAATLHENGFDDADEADHIAAYDAHRAEVRPYAKQRYPDDYGISTDYGWSEDKARQYGKPERAGFGAFVRRKGFSLA